MADSAHMPFLGDALRDARVRSLAQARRSPLAAVRRHHLRGRGGAAWLRLHPLADGAGFSVGLANGAANWLVQAAPQALFLATATWMIAETLADRTPSLSEAIRRGLELFVPLLAVHILYTLGTMASMVPLVVPGIIVALMRPPVTPVLVVERTGLIDTFQRSRDSDPRGHRWALLGLIVVYSPVAVALEWAIFQVSAPGKTLARPPSSSINAFGVVPALTVGPTVLGATVSAPPSGACAWPAGHTGSAYGHNFRRGLRLVLVVLVLAALAQQQRATPADRAGAA